MYPTQHTAKPRPTALFAVFWLCASCSSGSVVGSEESVGNTAQVTPAATAPAAQQNPPGSGNTAVASPDTTTSTNPNSSKTPGTARARCKRGVGADASTALALSANDLAALSPGVTWWYNWTHVPGGASVVAANSNLSMEYVPMVWTAPFDSNAIAAALSADARYLLTFNEPNFAVQGNLTPQQAASYWPQIEALADQHNLAIVSPALNFCGGACNETDPFVWLDQFFAACANCRVDYLAIHSYVCYDTALQSAYLKPFVQKYGKKLWLTEFSCGDGSADGTQLSVQKTYMQAAVADLEANDDVFRYAWFLARSGTTSPPIGLLNTDGGLSDLGSFYVSLPQSCHP